MFPLVRALLWETEVVGERTVSLEELQKKGIL